MRVGTRSRQENWVGFGQQEKTKENIRIKECEKKNNNGKKVHGSGSHTLVGFRTIWGTC